MSWDFRLSRHSVVTWQARGNVSEIFWICLTYSSFKEPIESVWKGEATLTSLASSLHLKVSCWSQSHGCIVQQRLTEFLPKLVSLKKFGTLCLFIHMYVVTLPLTLNMVSLESLFHFSNLSFVGIIYLCDEQHNREAAEVPRKMSSKCTIPPWSL